MTAPSKLGFQVEVTLLEVHRLPMGIARQCPQGCGLKLVGFQGGDDPAWCGLIALATYVLGVQVGVILLVGAQHLP